MTSNEQCALKMKKEDLSQHKAAPKHLGSIPQFKPLKRGKLPKPFNRVGGGRIHATPLIDVSDDHVAVFYYKNGEIFTDTSFYGFLLSKLYDGSVSPLFEFHWHPSHKGFHCKMPCETQLDYTNRMLPGAPELNLKTNNRLDPRNERDRTVLINMFCKWCGITLVAPSNYNDGQGDLVWN